MKLKQDELVKLQYLVQTLNKIITDLGIIETQKHSKLHEFAELDGQLNAHKRALNEAYGEKNINIQTGELTDVEGAKPKAEKPKRSLKKVE